MKIIEQIAMHNEKIRITYIRAHFGISDIRLDVLELISNSFGEVSGKNQGFSVFPCLFPLTSMFVRTQHGSMWFPVIESAITVDVCIYPTADAIGVVVG